MKTSFEFATATRIVFGAGAVRNLGSLARGFGANALVVTGQNPKRAAPILASLEHEGVRTVALAVSGEPSTETVEQGTGLARDKGCDLVISCGGGSAIDAGKAIAAMLTNEGELLDYLEVIGRGKPLAKPSAPFIAVPTTAGTGSEVTRNAVIASATHQVKVSLRGPGMLPRLAVVDPELTYDLPPAVTASTGLDALTQLIEPYVSIRANPMTDALCVEGIRRAARSLRAACQPGQHPAAREDMAVASLFGGLALANAGLGAVHGFAGPIGGLFSAPHGAVCAALLPHVMAANCRALRQRDPENPALARYAEIGRLVTNDQGATAEAGIDWTRQLVSDLKVPPLSTYGLQASHIPDLVAKSAKASSMKANPVLLTAEELGEILQAALP